MYQYSSTNPVNNGNISGNDNVGGIAGSGRRFSINTGSENNGDINGNENVGGLIGKSELGGVLNGLNTGNVTGYENVGGLAGLAKIGSGGTNEGKVTGEISVDDLYGKLVQ